jgi:hypothetical protein
MSARTKIRIACVATLVVAAAAVAACGGSGTSPSASGTAATPVFETGEVVSWSEASSRIGRNLTVEGPVLSAGPVEGDAAGTALNLGLDAPDAARFVVIVPGRLADDLPGDAADLYVDRLVRATGRIEEVDGVATITLRRPGDLRVLE